MRGVLFDLLMAVMNSLAVWTAAAGDERIGRAWRDAVTARMRAADGYVPYEDLVAAAAAECRLPDDAPMTLLRRWTEMQPWPDATAIASLQIPYAFLTNCSRELALVAAERSGLAPRFVLSAEEAGAYKPYPGAYIQACRRLGLSAEHILYVAGSPYDAEGAIRAGLTAVLVRRRPDQPIPSAVTSVVGSLVEVADIHLRRTGC